MLRTIFYIPNEFAGYPVFGIGILFVAWLLFSVVLLGYLIRRHGFDAETRGYLPLLIVMGATIMFILPALTDEHGLAIRGYGTMLVAAAFTACLLATHRAGQMGLDPEVIFSMAFWMFASGVVGARVFYIVEYWEQFQHDTLGATLAQLINVAQGGLVVYGGVIGGVVAMLVFLRLHRLPVLAVCDLIAPAAAVGLALGRVGCLLNGCCHGAPADVPWAVTFPIGSPPFVDQLERDQVYANGLRIGEARKDRRPVVGAVEPGSAAEQAGMQPGQTILRINDVPVETIGDAYRELFAIDRAGESISVVTSGMTIPKQWTVERPSRSLPVHPTQVYSSINALVIFALLWTFYPLRRRDGEVIALLMTIYPITRFLLEIIRNDEQAIWQTGLTISQNVSLMLLAAAVGFWFYLAGRPRGSVLPPKAVAA